MIVRNFTENDIEEASKIVHLVWGDLYAKESIELQTLIYNFTLNYYHLNNTFSFALDDNGLKGLVFAGYKTDKNQSIENFNARIETLPQDDKITALNFLDYVENTQKGKMPRIKHPIKINDAKYMEIDNATRANLEISDSAHGDKSVTLLGTMDRTITGAGARLLRARLASPSMDIEEINKRLDAIEFFINKYFFRQLIC